MSAAWTPGPWQVVDYALRGDRPVLTIHSDPDTRVCFMATPGRADAVDTIEANARLIACAPEMAEALQSALSTLEDLAREVDACGHLDDTTLQPRSICGELRAVLAKAGAR